MTKESRIHYEKLIANVFQRFRGVVDLVVLGEYFMAMFFYKYISDYWSEKYYQYTQLHADKELVNRKMSRERFTLNERLLFETLIRQSNRPHIGELINVAIGEIEILNAPHFENIFGHLDFNSGYNFGEASTRGQVLNVFLQCLEGIDLRPSNPMHEEIIDACIGVIRGYSEINSMNGGEYYTPSDLCSLLVRLVQAKEGDRIYDPCCGSGGLLVAATRNIKDSQGKQAENYALYGQERNRQSLAWAKMNMYLHGLDGFQLAGGDVIAAPAWKEQDQLMKFDIILSDPPFSSDNWGMEYAENDPYNRFRWGMPPSSKGDFAFIQHMLSSLNATGRIGIIIPHGVLFREGRELNIRKAIIEDNLI